MRRRRVVVASAAGRGDGDDDDDAETEDDGTAQTAALCTASKRTSTIGRRLNARGGSPCTVRSAVHDVANQEAGHDIQTPNRLRLQQATFNVATLFTPRSTVGEQTRWLARWPQSTSGPISTEVGDRIRVQFPVRDIYLGM